MEQEAITNETGGIRLPRNQQEFQILHWTWSMTTQPQFETTFTSIEPYHVGAYVREQWTIWNRRPLEFMAKWPTIAVQLIRDYEQRRNDYIKNKEA